MPSLKLRPLSLTTWLNEALRHDFNIGTSAEGLACAGKNQHPYSIVFGSILYSIMYTLGHFGSESIPSVGSIQSYGGDTFFFVVANVLVVHFLLLGYLRLS